MEYELGEAPEGYEWTLESSEGDPLFMGRAGMTWSIVVTKNGEFIQRQGVFVPADQESETQEFISGMEESLRQSL
ncbi:hypothetical protein SEA_YABOI_224 [Streptomyces phage Yaboi]|jgi:hypothetical protein|uniref:Uncharacterized protein n=3 Tax=Streptomyces virus Yaboi TaxID=2846408 RepID=A0A385UHJ8_9CAUD|nr:hypothetical protein HWB86_gp101 [Streptomyces phage Yaboi]QAY08841.1 hypothetical protein SEA_GENIE2_218 [Streptomyces phage Genie2]QAY12831.1 hypothetical protein SEA_BOOMERJR_218 [Streptomyces phage BoomerJR]UVD40026.1 hypothetical protein SEA_STANIMAL_219 [Streptomyces phage Stanimal]WNM73768.1 hypothetical protein SEA_SOLLERTIA_220 [Streptomyces phage Sollertia]AYB71018.1 hypothetical protein SEA_YABOI_224 [Streptomyces phage Yaboi]